MNRHIQGLLLTRIRAAEQALAPLLTHGLPEKSGTTDKQGLVQELGQFAETAEKTLRHEEQRKYKEIADTLLQAVRALPATADAAQTAPAGTLIADVLQETERMLSTEKCKKIFVFLPYKASMWDSLESVYFAAAEDHEHCEAYVVPIPYYDRDSSKPEAPFTEMHDERDAMPDEIPVEDYRQVDLELLHPDAIFIHNPYDGFNRITSIAPAYYSDRLKAVTDLLMYVPYYTTSGGMGEGQADCPVYANADYIVVQSESLRHFFADTVPMEKIVALGSPKFDRVIRLCAKRPEPPRDWLPKMKGKTVYFYNTSIGGMLADTQKFLQKMQYVFASFAGRQDVCLLWRPHPLLASTFQSMRPDAYPWFERLKAYFLEQNLGIYDDSPTIEPAIAWSDAYIGDAGTSVTALFGIVGKPLFILDNAIHREPVGQDYLGRMFGTLNTYGEKPCQYLVTMSNQLFYRKTLDAPFDYVTDLCRFRDGAYYGPSLFYRGALYLFPQQAMDILVYHEGTELQRIPLEHPIEKPGGFRGIVPAGKYVFLLPFQYDALVRLNMETQEIVYIRGDFSTLASHFGDEWRFGGACASLDHRTLWLGCPMSDQVLSFDTESLQASVHTVDGLAKHGCAFLMQDPYEGLLWIAPQFGRGLFAWNPETGETRRYEGTPESFSCEHMPMRYACGDMLPFSSLAFTRDAVYAAPGWGNAFLRFDRASGHVSVWDPRIPAVLPETQQNDYYTTGVSGFFLMREDGTPYGYVSLLLRAFYRIDFEKQQVVPVPFAFSSGALAHAAKGFGPLSQWLRYGCLEDGFNSLPGFLDGNVQGNAFDSKQEKQAFGEIAAYGDGSSGAHIYAFAMDRLRDRA